MKLWKPLKALPGYLGGKRRLLPHIFEHVPHILESDSGVFVDAFMGAGSVSLYAKARGFEIHANDIAFRSFVIGKALIENTEELILKEDMARLFARRAKSKTDFVERAFVPKVFTTKQARFIDNAFSNLSEMQISDAKRYLLILLVINHILSIRNFGKFTHTKDSEALEHEDYNTALAKKSRATKNLRHDKHPWTNLETLRTRINEAVFRNGQENKVTMMDAVEFMKTQERASIAYFDPPYAETTAYEDHYRVLDQILSQHRLIAEVVDLPEDNPWSDKTRATGEFIKLFEASKGAKKWIISMGQTDETRGITKEALLNIVKDFRPEATAIEIEHQWSVGNAGGEEKTNNKEYLIIA